MYGKSVFDVWIEKYGLKTALLMWHDKYTNTDRWTKYITKHI